MTLKEVLSRVAEIRENQRNGPQCHIEEDRLYRDVLAYIAAAPQAPGTIARMAKAALDTQSIDFDRWYE